MRAKVLYQKTKRVGRGRGSGHGKTSCRGQKGQGCRSGATAKPGFEGGQNPLYRRLPKRGFNHARFRREFATINLDRLNTLGEKEVTPEKLKALGVIKKLDTGLKVLGNGELKGAYKISAHRFSQSAVEKIKKAGGEAVVIENRGQKK